jgi:membrane protein
LFTRSFSAQTGQQVSAVLVWMLAGATLPFTALAFAILYVYLPNCRVQWRDAVVGGIAAAIAFECAKRGFGYYVRRIPSYTAVYGAFATLPMFLVWVYLSWFITLVGATITSALPEIRSGRFDRPVFAGSDLLDALELLARLAHAREDGQPGCTAPQLAQMLRCNLATVMRILGVMEHDGLVGRLDNEGAKPQFLLIANPAQIPVAHLFGRFVIDRKELAYQLGLKSSFIDADTLLHALDNDKLSMPLAALLMARPVRAGEAAAQDSDERQSMPPRIA